MPHNNINPKKLLNSKWTAVKPAQKEKHFLVTEVELLEPMDSDRVRTLHDNPTHKVIMIGDGPSGSSLL